MIKLRTLGESVIEIGAARLAPDADVLFAALVYLATERGRQHGRDSLAELFWPTVPHDRARHCLRQTIYRLRQIGVDLWTSPSHVELVATQVVPTFAAELGRAQLEAERAEGRLRLGAFLPGYAPAFSERFSGWLDRQRDHVHSQVRRALLASIEDRRARGEWAEVESLARECLAFDPLNEEATLALAESAALSGGKAEAIAILDEYIEELGPHAGDIRVPASVLRRRISERFPLRRYQAPADRCFVGRAPEMAILSTALQRARNAEGSATLLWGQPGIGKTRLATELRKVATLQGVRIVRVGCEESNATRPMGVWVDAVPPLLALPGALGCAPESLTYLRRLTEHDAARPAPSTEVVSAEFLAASIRRAIVDLVDAVCGEHPLLLLVEDAHWMDAPSWNVLHELIEWGVAKRLQLVFTSRTPHALPTPPSRLTPSLRVLELPPLSAAAGEALVRAVAEEDPSRELTPAVLDWCLSVGEGNPFFLRELAGYWVQTGKTREVPPSLQVLIDARITSLRPASLFVLQACAVLGRNATLERLEELLGLMLFEILGSLHELAAARLITSNRERVSLLHELISKRALALITAPALSLLNRSAARVLERFVLTTTDTVTLWDCANHWAAAGESERGLRVVLEYAKHLVRLGCASQAVEIYRAALQYDLDTDSRRAVLRGLALGLRTDSHWGEAASVLMQLLAMQPDDHRPKSPRIEDSLALLETGLRTGASMPVAHRNAMSIAIDRAVAFELRLRAAIVALICADNMCAREDGRDAWLAVADLLQEPTDMSVERLTLEMIYHVSFGDISIGARRATELFARLGEGDPVFVRARVIRNVADALRYSGEEARARSLMRTAYQFAAECSSTDGARVAADKLARMAVDRGDIADATRWIDLLERWTPATDDSIAECAYVDTRTRVALEAGLVSKANTIFQSCVRREVPEWEIRTRRSLIALRTSMLLASSNELIPASIVDELLEIHHRAHHATGHDALVVALVSALDRNGDIRKAHSVMSAYLTLHRRERSSLSVQLGRLVAPHHALRTMQEAT
jgi:DNA-binding SARP family transcriptional activator/tetratricopeptide (TPR) repeat protein